MGKAENVPAENSRRVYGFIRRNLFILIIAAVFIFADLPLTYLNPIGKSTLFWPNDFEITQRAHPERTWDKVFFGNSSVIAAYDDTAGGGYVNLGLDYGLLTDLNALLKGHFIDIGSKLVLGLNFLTLYDKFDTNKTYIWHKRFYEPYVYFERDRLSGFLNGAANALLEKMPYPSDYSGAKKGLYYGNLSSEELDIKRESFHKLYWDLPISDFRENLGAIDWLIGYCEKRGIEIKVLWMPWNSRLDVPDIALEVMSLADEKFERAGIEVINLMDFFEPKYFYDFGHLTAEQGRPIFTQYINTMLDGDTEVIKEDKSYENLEQ